MVGVSVFAISFYLVKLFNRDLLVRIVFIILLLCVSSFPAF